MSTKQPTQLHVHQLDRGRWLYELLSEVRQEVARQPSDEAIRRIRAQIEQGMEAETSQVAAKAAA